MPLFIEDQRPAYPYDLFVRITVTGNASASRERLLNRMKKKAAKFGADGLILMDEKTIIRESFDGVSAALNVISIIGTFTDGIEPLGLPVEGEYQTIKMEGIAFRFLKS